MNPEHEPLSEASTASPSPPLAPAGEGSSRVRRELEERLQERTLELARANQALIAEIARQRRTEETLRTSERRTRALLEHAWDGVSLLGADGTILYTTPPVERVLGYSPAEMTGTSGFDLLHPDDLERVRHEFGQLLQSPGATTSIEYRHRHKDGSWRWIQAIGTNRLADPDVRAIVVNHRDISERKHGEAALRRSEGLYRDVVEGSLQGIAVQQDSILRYVNPALTRIFGYDRPDEIIGRGWEALVAPEDIPILKARATAGLRGDTVTTLRVWQGIRKDGSRLWAESGMAIIAWHGRPAVLSFVLDVTERRKAELARRESEERFHAFMTTCPLIAFMKDADGRHIYVNPAFESTFGVQPADWKHKTDFELMPEVTARQLRANDVAILASGQPLTLEETILFPDGERHYVSFKFPFRNAAGQQFLAGMALDITERRQMEVQLRQAQKMEAVGRLAGGIAHDFNNLLTGILGYGDILLNDLGPTHPSHELVLEMQKAAERASLLTNQLLAFSRKQVLTPQVLNLNLILAEMEPMLRRLLGEDVQLLTLTEAASGFVKADLGQLQQVIVNLAVNARDAMPQGGTLVLHTSSIERREGSIVGQASSLPAARQAGSLPHADLGLPPGPYVALTVSDTGSGMTDEVRAHLFEPFFTTKERGLGSGLGLCTSYGIIKQSGGAIDVDTAPGTGSTFRIYLPSVEPDAEASAVAGASSSGPTAAPRGTETVLLVEDEDLVRALFLKVLTQQGYTVLPATCGEDALLQADKHTGPLHLLATDVVMPGISGRELAERLTAARPGLKVLFLSGYTDDAVLRHGVREAEAAFLQKPFTPDVLARKVREVLDRSPGRS
jgi:PAS domain S-box-containing protein